MAEPVRVADFVFSEIAARGVRSVFLVPGGGAMFLNDALAKNPDLDYVPNHHEQASAIAAEAYAKVSEKFGVVLVTSGPGATNAITGVAGAWLESIPVLVISGQVKRADLAGSSGLRQKGPQEIDIVTMVRSITKYAVTIMEPAHIRHHIEKAIHLATSGRPGPVWLDIPLDVQAAPIDPDSLSGYSPGEAEPPARGPSGDLDSVARRVVAALNESQRPVLLAGAGVRLSGAAEDFAELYRRLNAPVAATWPALDLISSDHPLSVGRPGAVAQRAPNFVIQNCDFLLSIGTRLDNSITAFNPGRFARTARRFVVDIDRAELEKFDPSLEVIEADAREFIRAILARSEDVRTVDRGDWFARCTGWKEKYPVGEGTPIAASGVISHYQFVRVLSEEVPAETLIVSGSSGLAIEFFFLAFQTKPGQRVLNGAASLGAMGFGLPAMIGAGIANGRRPFVGIESDGSLMFNIQELMTLKSLEIPVALFVMNNGGYASIRNTQRNYFDGRYIASGPASKLLLPDLVAVAKSMGIPGISIEDASDLREGVRLAIAHGGGPFICDVKLEGDASLWPKSSAIALPDGSMMSMPLEDMTPLLSRAELRANMIVPLDQASERVDELLGVHPR
jgi:acetolactate synthase-1/2/3 large subunit